MLNRCRGMLWAPSLLPAIAIIIPHSPFLHRPCFAIRRQSSNIGQSSRDHDDHDHHDHPCCFSRFFASASGSASYSVTCSQHILESDHLHFRFLHFPKISALIAAQRGPPVKPCRLHKTNAAQNKTMQTIANI